MWRNPGPIETLDLAAGPGGRGGGPVGHFQFVEKNSAGTSPKVVVSDARGNKWMVKFGPEAKAGTFASRIAWAAGYPTNASYYVTNGRIVGATSLGRAAEYVGGDGRFRGAAFQKFYRPGYREIPGTSLDLHDGQRPDQRELNALKLTALLVANWDVKRSNTGVFEIDGQRFAVITDWGQSMGDADAVEASARNWHCQAYSDRTASLIEGVFDGYVQFRYNQYLSRHVQALSANIPVEHLRWFMSRMNKLKDSQVNAALLASGATPEEAVCFTRAFRERLDLFARVAGEPNGEGIRSRRVKKTTTIVTQ